MGDILIILFIHWLFDFVFQTDKMALNKSKDNFWLTAHVITYLIGLVVMGLLIGFSGVNMTLFLLINFVSHWITDYGTSRLNSYLWKKEMRHWFFVSIGFDQFLHYAALLLTYNLMRVN